MYSPTAARFTTSARTQTSFPASSDIRCSQNIPRNCMWPALIAPCSVRQVDTGLRGEAALKIPTAIPEGETVFHVLYLQCRRHAYTCLISTWYSRQGRMVQDTARVHRVWCCPRISSTLGLAMFW
ncbi:hypothetical protein OE88DRAFT_445999 [Heliocybe sulcata]|uniref:Uncharacterized protein n=1 Tax=Heliocybe sulcata TaxID=5364 RepID=A0A5C3MVI0_9AGAM|nr:hypothetical protein OE88DRAFT_445999 [Heliocybe sulcata]